MKILLANKYFYRRSGAEVCFFETAELLEGKGSKVVFFSMKHPRNFSSEYEKYFVSNIDYERNGLKNKVDASLKLLYSFEARKKIERLIKDEKPDIVHLNNIYHQISPSILHAIKKHDLPVMMSLHDYKMVCASYSLLCNGRICEACKNSSYYHCFLQGCMKNSKLKSLLNTIEMYLHHKILHIYDLVDIFISPSKFLKYKVEEMGFKGKIVYLPNFVRIEDYKPQFNWEENSIVYVGALSKDKGLLNLIEAVKDIKSVTLKIIGEGPLKESLEIKKKGEGVNNVHFLGYKSGDELNNEIRKSMFVVLPSEWYEVFGLVIIEAFALGKPVIGAHIGAIPELVEDNKTGLTFEAGNTKDLRSKIIQLLKTPDGIVRMGKNARKFVEDEFNEEIHYKRLMGIYKSVL